MSRTTGYMAKLPHQPHQNLKQTGNIEETMIYTKTITRTFTAPSTNQSEVFAIGNLHLNRTTNPREFKGLRELVHRGAVSHLTLKPTPTVAFRRF